MSRHKVLLEGVMLIAILALIKGMILPSYSQEKRLSPSPRPRVAIVVGIDRYQALPQLRNAINDADLITPKLRALGFRVDFLANPEAEQLRDALTSMRTFLSSNKAIALFYFAGHGAQVSGRNLLFPSDAHNYETAIELSEVFRSFAKNDANIVILDACRDNPLDPSSGIRGLARPDDAPTGTFVAFSAAPGQQALDGQGANSPFAFVLSELINTPNKTIEEIFRMVRIGVVQKTRAAQTPWDTSSLLRKFFFVPQKELFPRSSEVLLEAPELTQLNCDDLWRARNEILSRSGWCFTSIPGRDDFETHECITLKPNFQKIELTNMRTIQSIEQQKKCIR